MALKQQATTMKSESKEIMVNRVSGEKNGQWQTFYTLMSYTCLYTLTKMFEKSRNTKEDDRKSLKTNTSLSL